AAAQLAVLLALALAAGVALPVAVLHGEVHHADELAGVVDPVRRRGIGQLRRRDQILPAKLGAVDAGDVGGVLDQPLHEVGGFGAAGAAIGSALRGVGEHAL